MRWTLLHIIQLPDPPVQTSLPDPPPNPPENSVSPNLSNYSGGNSKNDYSSDDKMGTTLPNLPLNQYENTFLSDSTDD